MHISSIDDLELLMSAHDKISKLLHFFLSWISDIKTWAATNMLKLI